MQAILQRACSNDPACRDVSPNVTDVSVRSNRVFHPACPDEIPLLAFFMAILPIYSKAVSDFCPDFRKMP